MDGVPESGICRSTWDATIETFGCALETEHSGQHTGFSRSRIAYWGGGIAEWTRA